MYKILYIILATSLHLKDVIKKKKNGNMAKRILMEYGQQKKLKEHFKVSRPTLVSALRYETQSELAKKIRYVAVKQFGGKEVEY